MAAYLLSLVIGLAVGVAYGLFGVRSPAPPIIALLGLLGMLAGESLVSYLRGHANVLASACHSKSFAIPSTGSDALAAGPVAKPRQTEDSG